MSNENKGTYCKEHDCPWYNTSRDICGSPNDPCGGECDYNWASKCPACHKLIAVGNDDDGQCPYCGAGLTGEEESEKDECNSPLVEKREWIEDERGWWYRKLFYCPTCGIQIRIESWNEKRCFGKGTILSDNSMPRFCPNCGTKLPKEKEEKS